MKNILITGASGGIGSEIANTLANKDTRLLLIGNKNMKNLTTLSENLSKNCEVEIFCCDLTNYDAMKSLIDDIIYRFKHIDVLINSAGVSLIKQIQDVTEADYDFVIDSNLKSTVLLTSLVSQNMISNHCGKIINISSMWGKVGASMESVYSASKGAINAFTLSLAKELGPSNITVNAICPGLIDTAMNNELTPETKKDIVASTPISRIGTPKDVANLVEFLSSDNSTFITGQIIAIDGGFSL